MEAAGDGQTAATSGERQPLLSQRGESGGSQPRYSATNAPASAAADAAEARRQPPQPQQLQPMQPQQHRADPSLTGPVELEAGIGPQIPPERLQERRGSDAGRQQFQAARQEAIHRNMQTRDSWRSPLGALVFVLGCFLIAIPPAIIIYIEVKSWQVLISFGNKPCDRDLVFWLIIRNVMTLTAPRMPAPGDPDLERAERQRRAAHWAATIWVFWLIVGYSWTNDCKTCQQTNPQLFAWVRFLTVFGLIVHVMNIFFPLLLLLCAMLYHGMVARGWIKSPNAANDDAIDSMDRVEYNAETFTSEGPDCPGSECCVCSEEFGVQKTIVRTPCSHYYHYDCLKEWLKLSKTCPLCRGHLDTDPAPEQHV